MSDVIYKATFTGPDLYRRQTGPLQMEIVQLEHGRFRANQQVLNFGDISFCLTCYELRQTTRVETKPSHVTLLYPLLQLVAADKNSLNTMLAVVLPRLVLPGRTRQNRCHIKLILLDTTE